MDQFASIRTRKHYSNYQFLIEYKILLDKSFLNIGFHNQEGTQVKVSMSTRMAKGYSGSFIIDRLEYESVVSDHLFKKARENSIVYKVTKDFTNGVGNWNTMIVNCASDNISAELNGQQLFEIEHFSQSSGSITFITGSACDIQIRKIQLTPFK